VGQLKLVVGIDDSSREMASVPTVPRQIHGHFDPVGVYFLSADEEDHRVFKN
jgi:hypothetical protein